MMTFATQANAHSGGLNKNGCHAGFKPYHCHRAQAAAPQAATEGQMLTGTINHVPLCQGDQPSGPASASGISCPFKRASARHLCSVASEIPSSCANCRMATLFGGSIRFSTADFRSGEYPTSLSYPAHLKNRAADNYPDTGGLGYPLIQYLNR
jgi:hypothetical protein